MTSDLTLSCLRELANAATPGEWIAKVVHHGAEVRARDVDGNVNEIAWLGDHSWRPEGAAKADAAYIAAANPLVVLKLLDRSDKLGEIERLLVDLALDRDLTWSDGNMAKASGIGHAITAIRRLV